MPIDRTVVTDDNGKPAKVPGWFSWRHADRAACDAARESYGGRRAERQAAKRRDAEARNAATPIERTRRFRRQQAAA